MVRNESELPDDYELARQGVRTESRYVAPFVKAEEVFTTSKGDYLRVQERRLDPSTGPYEAEVVKLDVGAGSNALLKVVEDPSSAPSESTGLRVESAPYTNPLAGESGSPDAPIVFPVPPDVSRVQKGDTWEQDGQVYYWTGERAELLR